MLMSQCEVAVGITITAMWLTYVIYFHLTQPVVARCMLRLQTLTMLVYCEKGQPNNYMYINR